VFRVANILGPIEIGHVGGGGTEAGQEDKAGHGQGGGELPQGRIS